MADVNFGNFDLVNNPNTGSFVVGYKANGTEEQRVPVGFFINTGDARLSDARTPTSHASSHVDGEDDIQNASPSQKGLMTTGYAAKLEGIAASANNYVLPVAETGTIGGIKRNEGGSSLFVTGVASDGSLLYGSPAGAGTVTSVAVSGSDGIEVDSGSPITSDGTIFLGINAANLRNHLDIESGANNYVLPVAETSVIGGIKRNAGGSALFVTGVSSAGDLLYGAASTSNSLEGNIAIPFAFYTGSMVDTPSGQFSANASDVSTLTEFRISAFPTGGSIDLDYLTGIRSGDYLLINSPNKAFAAKITSAGMDEIPNTVLYSVSNKLGSIDLSDGGVSYLQFDRSSGATYSHPNHTGDVTSVGDGATTIANNAVTFAKFQQISSTTLVGRHAGGSGNTQEVSVGNGLEFSGSGIRRSALTGDVTATAGSNSTTIANSAVTNAKMANMAQATIKGRALGAGTGAPVDLTATEVRTIINVADGANNYSLPVAGLTTIGGVKRNEGSVSQFITGVNSSGDLLYGTNLLVNRSRIQNSTQTNTSSTTIPFDATAPQITEGAELLTLSHAALNSSNELEIEFTTWASASALASIVFALFVAGTNDAITATPVTIPAANYAYPVTLRAIITAGSTSSLTYSIRWATSVGTAYVNRNTGATFGISKTLFTIQEFTV